MKDNSLETLVTNTIHQDNPLAILDKFLSEENRFETAREVQKMRFVGYVIEIGFDSAKIITSDTYKIIVGGIPRGSFLIMVPLDFNKLPPHFSLLRVKGVSTTPLSSQVQQTYFELHKKSMPELDVWTQSELQWGALDCDILGMFYPNPKEIEKLEFSGDVNNIVSAHRYKVYSPNDKLLNLIVNGIVPTINQYELGFLRTMECLLSESVTENTKIPVKISVSDFKGKRTAMFGKTRLGKSNVVKLIAQGIIDATTIEKPENSIGQLIFDINGEYANDNPQDGNISIRSKNHDRCIVYALTQRSGTPSNILRLNFYEHPCVCMQVLATQLSGDKRNSIYIQNFSSVSLIDFKEINELETKERTRPLRKILYYWAILKTAGFSANEEKIKRLVDGLRVKGFDPGFSANLREKAYSLINKTPETNLSTIDKLISELEVINEFKNNNPSSDLLNSKSSGKPIFDADDIAMLNFLFPKSGSGPSVLSPYRKYHDKDAGDYTKEILSSLDCGMTIIIDLGNAEDVMRRYFSDSLSLAVFRHQENKFVNNTLHNHFIQLYFEEAHNLFPIQDTDLKSIYARFAKEGAKFHIGMVYSTQSPSTISKELLAQTENFFVGHLSSQDEAHSLSRLQVAFDGIEQDILRSKTPGFMRMLTMSNRFVIPVQTKLFE